LAGSARGLVLGYLLDACLGDPRRHHPVAAYGALVWRLERRMHAPARTRGVVFWCVCVAAPVAASALPARLHGPPTRGRGTLLTAMATWAVLGQRSLVREGLRLADALRLHDLGEARGRLPALCGRGPSSLDRQQLARAGVESLAENTADAVVAPLLWGALLGVPGLVGYRAVNTLDAMVGNRSDRHREFGWASARADDLANLVPARLTAALTCVAAPLVGGRTKTAWSTWRRYGHRHPSPNAGQCEAAAAGALGLRLGGRLEYPSGVEDRPVLGDGALPGAHDVRRAARLSAGVGLLAAALCAGVAAGTAAGTAAIAGARP
jgi:adenosylcobinamide-phosphate synthase